MENNNITAAETCLDELLYKQVDEAAAKSRLAELGDTDASTSIALHQQAVAALQRYRVLQQVQSVHRAYLASHPQTNGNTDGLKPARVVKLKPLQWVLRIAAVFVVVLGISLTYLYVSNDGEQLYSELHNPYNVVVDRAETNQAGTKLVALYEAQNYQGVLDEYSRQPSKTTREQFFAGMAYSELQQFENAVPIFEGILANNKINGSRLYNDEAEYYLGLAYLKKGQYNKAYDLFSAIHNDNNHTYSTKVSQWLLIKLKWLR